MEIQKTGSAVARSVKRYILAENISLAICGFKKT
jgi:hypothetical protein